MLRARRTRHRRLSRLAKGHSGNPHDGHVGGARVLTAFKKQKVVTLIYRQTLSDFVRLGMDNFLICTRMSVCVPAKVYPTPREQC